MRLLSLSAALLLAATALGCRHQRASEGAASIADLRGQSATARFDAIQERFAIVLLRSSSGWSARCLTGCSWREVTTICDSCEVRIDDSGIGPAKTREGTSGFAFTLRASGGGWEARSLSGTHWTGLGYTCGPFRECRARINQSGVRGI